MKKRLFLLLLTLFFIPSVVNAKEIKEDLFGWGGSKADSFDDVVATSDGGYVVVGYTSSADVEGITNNGISSAIIVKYDKDRNIEWQKNYGGNGSNTFKDIVVTSDDGYIVVGSTSSTDIEGITAKGRNDAYIIKIDKAGNVEWQQNYGGSNDDYFESVTLASDGGYVVVGYTNSDDIDGITHKGYGDDAVIIKYDKNGNVEWQQNYGGTGTDEFKEIASTLDSGYIIVGYTYSNDIEGILNRGDYDAIIVKYDKDGNIEWQQNYGGNGSDMFNGITVTSDGGCAVIGDSNSTNIEGITNIGASDALIVKYDKNGNIEWQKNYGGSNSDYFF